MALDITSLRWGDIFGTKITEENDYIGWLEENIGPQIMGLPCMPLPEEGRTQEVRERGERWAITFNILAIDNPVAEQDWGKGICARLPYSKKIETSKYYLHVHDVKLAVMFKLRWL